MIRLDVVKIGMLPLLSYFTLKLYTFLMYRFYKILLLIIVNDSFLFIIIEYFSHIIMVAFNVKKLFFSFLYPNILNFLYTNKKIFKILQVKFKFNSIS